MRKKTLEEFIKEAKKVHGGKYEYKGTYQGQNFPLTATCQIHGDFLIIPKNHLRGYGCKKCNGTERLTTETFIKRCKEKFGDLYDYSKTVYKNENTYIVYDCQTHGEVKQLPMNHLKYGCGECGQQEGYNKKKMKWSEFLEKAKQVHKDKYDYSNVEYKDYKTQVNIVCTACGKTFSQSPQKHLLGHGCINCKESILEKQVAETLETNGITFIKQANKQLLKWLGGLTLDFYIPSKNIAIECQGIQHFQPNIFFGGLKFFEKQVERDNIKLNLCNEHGIALLYYSNLDIVYPYTVYTNIDELITQIKNF